MGYLNVVLCSKGLLCLVRWSNQTHQINQSNTMNHIPATRDEVVPYTSLFPEALSLTGVQFKVSCA